MFRWKVSPDYVQDSFRRLVLESLDKDSFTRKSSYIHAYIHSEKSHTKNIMSFADRGCVRTSRNLYRYATVQTVYKRQTVYKQLGRPSVADGLKVVKCPRQCATAKNNGANSMTFWQIISNRSRCLKPAAVKPLASRHVSDIISPNVRHFPSTTSIWIHSNTSQYNLTTRCCSYRRDSHSRSLKVIRWAKNAANMTSYLHSMLT